jgi:hypothetical protein
MPKVSQVGAFPRGLRRKGKLSLGENHRRSLPWVCPEFRRREWGGHQAEMGMGNDEAIAMARGRLELPTLGL